MKKLLFILSLFLIITSCNKTPVITLSVDKTEISADSIDKATFKVICDDEKDVTKDCRIFFADSKKELGATAFSTTEPNTYSFYATYDDAVSETISVTAIEVENEEPENPEEPEQPENPEQPEQPEQPENPQDTIVSAIVLSASKTTILNDGKDKVTFTVTQDSVEITGETKIYVGDTKLRFNVFTSKTAGTYTAYAMKGEVKSNEIVITVEDGNEQPENPENPEQPENPEVPEVPEAPIELTASTTNITANGIDAVTFTVMQENKDVTSQSNIFINGNKLNGNKFTTYTSGSYTAYAQKNEVKSNEITITVTDAPDMGRTVVFAEGVTLTSGWYDVNKKGNGQTHGDINMCWAASCANIIQWWQDRYVAAGNSLPAGAVTGPGTIYELALMEIYRDLWDNSRGGTTSHGITWYFEGRNIMKEASAGSHAQPLNETSGGYYAEIWNQILPDVYHEYDYVIVPGVVEYNDLISTVYNNYDTWGNGSGLSGEARLKKFSDLVVEFMDRGVISLAVALADNLGSLHHATTMWGYEIDNATGILTKIWITDSDDMTSEPKQQKLHEYAVSYNEKTGTIKFSGAPYGACYAVSLIPVSGYNSAK